MKLHKIIHFFILLSGIVRAQGEAPEREGRLLSKSPDEKYIVRSDESPDEASSGIYLVESMTGKKILRADSIARSNSSIWSPDSSRFIVTHRWRWNTDLIGFAKQADGRWEACSFDKTFDFKGNPPKLQVSIHSMVFDKSGNLCLFLKKFKDTQTDPEIESKIEVDFKVARFALVDKTWKFLDEHLIQENAELEDDEGTTRASKEALYGGVAFPIELAELNKFKLYKKMDSSFHMGYYITNNDGYLNILKITNAVPGAGEKFVKNNYLKDGYLLALLTPIKKDFKKKLYFVKELNGNVQLVKLDNDQISSYVETTQDMCFDEGNGLYLLCEQPDIIEKVKLSIVRISWDQGVKAEVISEKIVPIERKLKTLKQMESDANTHSKNNPHPPYIRFASLKAPE